MKPLPVLAMLVAVLVGTSSHADIYQWEYIDPLQPELGRQKSSTVAPDGLGRDAAPGSNLADLDLTKAWLHEHDLHGAYSRRTWLINADLSGADLDGVDFWNAKLSDADLTGASVRETEFRESRLTAAQLYSTASYQMGDLTGIGLSGNDLERWNFVGQNLTKSNFSNSWLTDANFTDAIINGIDLFKATSYGLTDAQFYSTESYQSGDLTGISLTLNDLTGWNFAGQNLTGASLVNTILTDADFTNAVIRGANFRQGIISFPADFGLTAEQLHSTASYKTGDLVGIDFQENDLTGWNFSEKNLTDANFLESILTDADLRGANLNSARLSNAVLTGANLSGANLIDASFNDTTFTDADFTGATIQGSNFGSTTDSGFVAEQLYSTASYQAGDLTRIDLGGNDLTGWNLAGKNLAGASLRIVTLENASLGGANFAEVDFYYADLTGANLSSANLTGTNFDGATLNYADLNGSNLSGAEFGNNASLVNANLSNANLTHADFWGERTDLTGAIFVDAKVKGARFGRGFSAQHLYSTASYKARDLTAISLSYHDLTNWDLSGQNLTDAVFHNTILTDTNFTNADIHGADLAATTGFTSRQLYSTASYRQSDLSGIRFNSVDLTNWDFAGQNLQNVIFDYAILDGANLVDSDIQGATFYRTTSRGFQAKQLYTTASYQGGNLSGVHFGDPYQGFFTEDTANDLSGWDFIGLDLTNAGFSYTILADARFESTIIRGADFSATTQRGFTATQLYATASYEKHDLTEIQLGANDLTDWDLTGQKLVLANFYDAVMKDTNLSGADARAAVFPYPNGVSEAITHNLIYPDGHVDGLQVVAYEMLRLRDLDPTLSRRLFGSAFGDPIGDIPIVVKDAMSIDPAGTLRAVFEDDEWGSTITFAPGIPVILAGTLELLIDTNEEATLPSLVGTTYRLFDWAGVEPEGQFDLILTHNGLLWNANNLYTTGEVTLIGAVPEPTTLFVALLGLAGAVSCISRTQR